MRKALGSIPSVSIFGRVAGACVRTRAHACARTGVLLTHAFAPARTRAGAGPCAKLADFRARSARINPAFANAPTAPPMCAHARKCQQRTQCHDTAEMLASCRTFGHCFVWCGARPLGLPCHSRVAPWVQPPVCPIPGGLLAHACAPAHTRACASECTTGSPPRTLRANHPSIRKRAHSSAHVRPRP